MVERNANSVIRTERATENDESQLISWLSKFVGAPSRIRTDHPRITSAVLYQMSYKGIPKLYNMQ